MKIRVRNHYMQNVNTDEIAKFSAFANDWWNPTGSMKALHALNPLRLHYIKKHAEIVRKNVLDIGCGGGILTESLSLSGAIATGIDMSEAAIQIAKQHAEKSEIKINYFQTRTEDFTDQHKNNFDVITCMEMLEHVPDPQAIIQAASQLLKPGGFIFFSTINRNLKSFVSAIVGAEYILNLLPKGTHHYETFIRPSELTHWAEKNNLCLCDIQGITYRPFKKTFEMTCSVDVNYVMVFQKMF